MPAFEYGDMVRVIRTIRNDGTFPGMETGAQLVRAGSMGHIRNVGTFLQEQIVYAVHFVEEDRIVGCREEELVRSDAPWTTTKFLFRDHVVAHIPLAVGGQVVVTEGSEGEVVLRLGDAPRGRVIMWNSTGVCFKCRKPRSISRRLRPRVPIRWHEARSLQAHTGSESFHASRALNGRATTLRTAGRAGSSFGGGTATTEGVHRSGHAGWRGWRSRGAGAGNGRHW